MIVATAVRIWDGAGASLRVRRRPSSSSSWPRGWRPWVCRLWARSAGWSRCRPACSPDQSQTHTSLWINHLQLLLFLGNSSSLVITSTLDPLAVGPKLTRRAAAAAIDRYLLAAPDLSSKPAGRRCCCRSTGQTDGCTNRLMDWHSAVLWRLAHTTRDRLSKIQLSMQYNKRLFLSYPFLGEQKYNFDEVKQFCIS